MGSKKYVYMLRIPAIRILCEKINANETTTAQMIKNAVLMVVITIVSLKIPTKNMVQYYISIAFKNSLQYFLFIGNALS